MSDGSHTARRPWPWPDPAEGRPGPAFARTATRPTDSYGNEHEIESMPLAYARNVIDGAVSVAGSALTLVAQGSDPEGATQSALEASVEAQSEPGADAPE